MMNVYRVSSMLEILSTANAAPNSDLLPLFIMMPFAAAIGIIGAWFILKPNKAEGAILSSVNQKNRKLLFRVVLIVNILGVLATAGLAFAS